LRGNSVAAVPEIIEWYAPDGYQSSISPAARFADWKGSVR
jgi:hypothetical protein